jgi:hypothetical protein
MRSSVVADRAVGYGETEGYLDFSACYKLILHANGLFQESQH